MLNNGVCNSLATYNKVVGSKVVVVASSIKVMVGTLMVNLDELNVINLLSAILRFPQHHLLLLHFLYLLLHQHWPPTRSETM